MDISEHKKELGRLSSISFCCNEVEFAHRAKDLFNKPRTNVEMNLLTNLRKLDGVKEVTFPKIHICLNSAHSAAKLK